MTGRNVTRVDLAEAVYERVGLSRTEAADLVRQVIEEVSSVLATGEGDVTVTFGQQLVV